MGRSLGVVAAVAALMSIGAVGASAATLTARGSVEQVQVTGAQKGAKVTLVDRRGRTVATQKAGPLGGAVFRRVKPGKAYKIRTAAGKATKAFTVLPDRSAPPSTRIYNQKIPSSNYGYLTTRDGTQLAIAVRLPAGAKPP